MAKLRRAGGLPLLLWLLLGAWGSAFQAAGAVSEWRREGGSSGGGLGVGDGVGDGVVVRGRAMGLQARLPPRLHVAGEGASRDRALRPAACAPSPGRRRPLSLSPSGGEVCASGATFPLPAPAWKGRAGAAKPEPALLPAACEAVPAGE